jgi:hypothetical protein
LALEVEVLSNQLLALAPLAEPVLGTLVPLVIPPTAPAPTLLMLVLSVQIQIKLPPSHPPMNNPNLALALDSPGLASQPLASLHLANRALDKHLSANQVL